MSDKPEEQGRGDPPPQPLTDEEVYATVEPSPDPRVTHRGMTEEEEAAAAKAAADVAKKLASDTKASTKGGSA